MIERLKEIRERRGIPLRVLAEAAGMHYVSLVRLEKETDGPGSDPRLSTLSKLAKALQTTIAELIGESDISESLHESQKRRRRMKSANEKDQQRKLNEAVREAKAAIEDWQRKFIVKRIRPLIWGYDYKEIEQIIRLLQLKLYNQTE